jgi:HEAT repeat protein
MRERIGNFTTALCLSLSLAGCQAVGALTRGAASGAAPSGGSDKVVAGKDIKNEVSEKHYDFSVVSGNYSCKPKGLLKTLLDEPNECNRDLTSCKAGAEALEGKLDPGATDLFVDTITPFPDGKREAGARYKMFCGNLGPRDLYELGISGLGFVGTAAHAKMLEDLVSDETKQNEFAGRKHGLIRTLYYIGSKGSLPVINRLLMDGGYTHGHQPIGLEYLARWGSDAAVDWCMDVLKGDTSRVKMADDSTKRACVVYLGRMRATKAVPFYVRNLETYGEEGVRALGQIGDKSAIPTLEQQLAKYKPNQYTYRIPILAALVNLGEKKHLQELKGYVAASAAGTREAAMEMVAITNPAVAGEIKDILKSVKDNAGDWQPRVYALIARAQRGDEQAAAKLADELKGPQGDIREAILEASGGNENPQGPAFWRRGLGVIASKTLFQAMLDFYGVESEKGKRQTALVAALNIRATTR